MDIMRHNERIKFGVSQETENQLSTVLCTLMVTYKTRDELDFRLRISYMQTYEAFEANTL